MSALRQILFTRIRIRLSQWRERTRARASRSSLYRSGHNRRPISKGGNQSGVVALAVVMLWASLSFGFWLGTQTHQRSDDLSAVALSQARDALLAWTLNYYQKTGSGSRKTPRGKIMALPCPDLNKGLYSGASAGVCGKRGQASLGLLPWRSLGSTPLNDASHSCLWYLVAGHYKNSPYPGQLNAFVPGGWVRKDNRLVYHRQVEMSARANAAHIAAIVFAPGAPLPHQRRPARNTDDCPESGHVQNYLESVEWVNTTDSAAQEALLNHHSIDLDATGNDRLIYITHHQLWQTVLSNSMILDLLHKDFPSSIAECVARVLKNKNPAKPSVLATDYILNPLCKDLRDRRMRDLMQHWGERVNIVMQTSTTEQAIVVGMPMQSLSKYTPVFFGSIFDQPGLATIDIGQDNYLPDNPYSNKLWYCVSLTDQKIQPCTLSTPTGYSQLPVSDQQTLLKPKKYL